MKTPGAKLTIVCTLALIVLTSAGVSYAQIDPASVLVAWLFDEDGDDIAEDSSGNGRNGQIVNDVVWVDGKFGKALEFDGVSGHVVLPESKELIQEGLTLAAWINIDDKPHHQGIVGAYSTPLGAWGTGVAWAIFCHQANDEVFGVLTNDDASQSWRPVLVKNPDKSVWYHVAITNDGKTAIGYANGEQAARVDKAIDFGSRFDLVMSDPRAGGAWGFDGMIDEVVVLNVALTEDYIKIIMNKGLESALGISAVDPSDKLTTNWATVKSRY